jgi:hypothetical protein
VPACRGSRCPICVMHNHQPTRNLPRDPPASRVFLLHHGAGLNIGHDTRPCDVRRLQCCRDSWTGTGEADAATKRGPVRTMRLTRNPLSPPGHAILAWAHCRGCFKTRFQFPSPQSPSVPLCQRGIQGDFEGHPQTPGGRASPTSLQTSSQMRPCRLCASHLFCGCLRYICES